jgi:predicted dehydrogenase
LPQLTKRTDAVEVVALSDVNIEAAKATAAEYSIPRYTTDYKEWLADVDAVLVGVPTFLHASIGIDVANAGKHLFMEKPFTRTQEQAEALIDAVEKNGVSLQVGFVRRFDNDWMTWRDLILKEKIGRPVVWRDVSAIGGPASPWFNNEEQGGGPFIDGCIHNIDFGLYTFGPVDWVFCHGRTIRETNTAIDTGTATVHFKSGDELMLAWSWGLPFGANGGRAFYLFGSKGVLKYGDAHNSFFRLEYGGDETEDVSIEENSIVNAFDYQMDEWIEVASGKKQPRAGAAEGLESLKVALAILKSGRTGEVVRL